MLKEWKQLKCSVCGGQLDEKNEKLVCRYCRTVYECIERISEAEVIALNRATALRNRLMFDDAQEEYDLLLKSYPNNSEAAWGAFLCSYGIIYEQDYDGSYKPTCHRLNECPVEKSRYYSKLSTANKVRAREIETLRQSILAQAKTIPPYDVFICYKATDDWHGRNMPTKESSWARDIYELLTRDMGLKVFFAEKCLSSSNTDYEPHIYSALQSAKLMLVLANSLDHVNAVWVQNEWRRYAKYIREGKQKTIRVIFDGIEPYSLPRELQAKQAICHDSMGWDKQIEKSVNEIFRKEEPKKDKRDEELEFLKKQLEELKNAQKAQATQQTKPATSSPVIASEARQSANQNASELAKIATQYADKGNYVKAAEYYQKASDLGSKEAQSILAYWYKIGQGVPKDLEKSATLFEKAANQGLATAQSAIGYCYNNGEGVTKNDQKAVYWYQKAAEQGYAKGQYNLAGCYKNGIGVEKNIEKAIFWYEKAAKQNYPQSKEQLDYLKNLQNSQHQQNKTTQPANPVFPKSADLIIENGILKKYIGNDTHIILPNNITSIGKDAFMNCKTLKSIIIPEGVTSIGLMAFFNCENLERVELPVTITSIGREAFHRSWSTTKKLTIYSSANEQPKTWTENWNPSKCPVVWGYKGEQRNPSLTQQTTESAEKLFSQGLEFYNKKDYTNAVKYFQQSANQGHAKAQYNLAVCYEYGKGVSQSDSSALTWYKKAHSQGIPQAKQKIEEIENKFKSQTNNSSYSSSPQKSTVAEELFNKGWACHQQKNYSRAVEYYKQACELNHPVAQNNLGVCYENGLGVPQNNQKAVYWYQKSANQSYDRGLYNLSNCYFYGNGVAQDRTKAAQLAKKAADQGFHEAQNRIGYQYLNGFGVGKNYAEAVKYFNLAAKENMHAQYNLAYCYENGLEVEKNLEIALLWYRKSSNNGYAQATPKVVEVQNLLSPLPHILKNPKNQES